MSWFDLPRVPEPEVMDDCGEVDAYSSAAAQSYLSAIDDTFVDQALRLVGRRSSGRGLDIGTGPGQIVWKMAKCLPGWHWTGIDRSPNMIRQANAGLQKTVSTKLQREESFEGRVEFLVADANGLPFADDSFDLVTSNSVLHHLEQPRRVLTEIARVISPDGAILLRDLRRPSRLAYSPHVRWYGRHYSGLMYKLYCDSVHSAYTAAEIAEMAEGLFRPDVRVFRYRRTHIGLERALR